MTGFFNSDVYEEGQGSLSVDQLKFIVGIRLGSRKRRIVEIEWIIIFMLRPAEEGH